MMISIADPYLSGPGRRIVPLKEVEWWIVD
jgi:hypothetical protein